MHKTEGTYNVAGEFVDEVPGVSPGTIVEEGWLNTVQRELVNIVEEADIALDSGNDAQVLAALAVLFRGYVKTIIVTDDDRFNASLDVLRDVPGDAGADRTLKDKD